MIFWSPDSFFFFFFFLIEGKGSRERGHPGAEWNIFEFFRLRGRRVINSCSWIIGEYFGHAVINMHAEMIEIIKVRDIFQDQRIWKYRIDGGM